MSLILDALRKAEADRQRGAVPGLHAVAVAPPPARPPRVGTPPWAWPVLAVLVLLLASGAWWLLAPSGVAPADPANPVSPGKPALAAPAAQIAQSKPGQPLPQVVSAPPTTSAVSSPLPPAIPSPVERPPVERPSPPDGAARPAIVTQVLKLADLPPEQRRELPPLVVGGSVWSDQASVRFVVLDGQVLREGDTVAPGLVLLKLAPRAATLRWRQGLIELPF